MTHTGQQEETGSQFISALVTTSHNPSHLLRQRSKTLCFTLPDSLRINRGSLNLKQLFNYCWNRKISRLLILHGSEDKKTVRVKIYSISTTVTECTAKIELSDFILLNKHQKNRRIIAENIQLGFHADVDRMMKRKIESFFEPFVLAPRRGISRSRKHTVIFYYEMVSNTHLEGKTIQEIPSGDFIIYKSTIRDFRDEF